MDGEGVPVVIRRAILAALMLASPALAFPPSAIDDMMGGLIATSTSGGYSDAIQTDSRLIFRLTTLDTSSYSLSGTNLASWTDTKGRLVASSTGNARPWYVADDFNGKAGFGFGGGQYLDIAGSIPSTNVLIVVVGYRATQTTMFTVLSHTNATSGLLFSLWNDQTLYFNPAAPNVQGASFSAVGVSNRILVSAAHFGGNVTTNNMRMWTNATIKLPLGIFMQTSVATNFNRVGARKSDGYAIGRFNEIAVFNGVADTNAAQEIISTMKGIWGL